MIAQQPEARTGGIDVRLSHLNKVFFPDDGITERDLAEGYRQMALWIITFAQDRPLVMHRFSEGITGPRIVQQNIPGYFPDWMSRTLRERLAGELDLTCYVKTTGGKALHVHVPVLPRQDFDTVRGFAHDVASVLAVPVASGPDHRAARGPVRAPAVPGCHLRGPYPDRRRAPHGAGPAWRDPSDGPVRGPRAPRTRPAARRACCTAVGDARGRR